MKELFKQTLQEMQDIMEKKNHDYTNGDIDPFYNFTMCEKFGITTTERGMLVRMTDKLSRIITLLDKKGKVEDEKVDDTLKDLGTYAILLLCYLKLKKK